MIKKTLIALGMSLAFATGALAGGPGMHVAADDIAWQDLGLPGFSLALAWGTEEAGDAIWLIRMEPGTVLPRHAHTNDYWGITISGNWVHIHEDGSETATGPGDHELIKGGVFHADRCDGDEVCLGLLDFNGARDAIFEE